MSYGPSPIFQSHSSLSPIFQSHSSLSPIFQSHSSLSPIFQSHSSLSPIFQSHCILQTFGNICEKPWYNDAGRLHSAYLYFYSPMNWNTFPSPAVLSNKNNILWMSRSDAWYIFPLLGQDTYFSYIFMMVCGYAYGYPDALY